MRTRLNDLQALSSKWHPEILFLLLELSDQPTFNTNLDDLQGWHPLQDKAPALRWETVAKEDGWDQDAALWKTISYDDSSDDDLVSDGSLHDSVATSDPDPGDGHVVGRTANDLVVQIDNSASFDAVRKAQEWRTMKPSADESGHVRKTAVDELQVAREVLFMLQGLETTMFDPKCNPMPSFQTSHILWDTHRALMNTFSEYGRQLRFLRKFTRGTQDVSHLQAFQDCVAASLADFDAKLSGIHARLAVPSGTVVVSLISLQTELVSWLEPLLSLGSIIGRIAREQNPGAFRYLELLFHEANNAQLGGRQKTYEFLSRTFVDCFNVYLRPIRLWMDEGRLVPDDEMFFVYELSPDVELGELWRSRFKLRKTQDGKLHAPEFLHPAASKILNAGKNLVVLTRLGQAGVAGQQRASHQPLLKYEDVCPPGLELASFSELFASAFDRWIQSKYGATSATLRDVLHDKCCLPQALEALHCLYLMSDGSAASTFCEDVFERIDMLDPRWADRSALTAIAHDAFGHLVDSNRLFVSVTDEGRSIPVAQAKDLVQAALPHIRLTYRLPWPIRMVLSSESNELYQAIFSWILQLKRATYVLHKPRVLDNYWSDHDRWEERALYYLCRSRLLWFCTTMQTYLSSLVLTPNLLSLHQALQAAQDVDTITAVHDAFVKQVVDEACLGDRLRPIRACMVDVLDLATKLEHERQVAEEQYIDVLRTIKADFDKHLRFICEGLKGVARAGSDAPAARWDILADMLQAGGSSAG